MGDQQLKYKLKHWSDHGVVNQGAHNKNTEYYLLTKLEENIINKINPRMVCC